jgi:hypothetical protein
MTFNYLLFKYNFLSWEAHPRRPEMSMPKKVESRLTSVTAELEKTVLMGKHSGGSFQAIQEYFRRQSCRYCFQPYDAEGIQLLREEPGILVVRVGCIACGRPLGVAIVGTTGKAGASVEANWNQCPADWTKRDVQKFDKMPAINYDDVLQAHEFFQALGSDWSKQLGRKRSKTSTQADNFKS